MQCIPHASFSVVSLTGPSRRLAAHEHVLVVSTLDILTHGPARGDVRVQVITPHAGQDHGCVTGGAPHELHPAVVRVVSHAQLLAGYG